MGDYWSDKKAGRYIFDGCIFVVVYEWIAAAVHSFYVAMHPKKAAGGRFIGMERVYDGGALQLAN